MNRGTKVITILGSGTITDYHPATNQYAVVLGGVVGQEWFEVEEIEEGVCNDEM